MNCSAEKIKSEKLLDGQIGIWYLGQEGFLFKTGDKYILIDPYLSDYVDVNCSQLVKWERLYSPPIDATALDFADYAFFTHSHYDHTDPYTIKKILSVNKKIKFITPAPERDLLLSYGVSEENIICAFADMEISLCGFSVLPIPSAHEVFHTDENGNFKELGYIFNFGTAKFFHAGDMCMYDGLIKRLKNIDIGFLPINGRDYFRNKNDIIGNFNAEEAVTLGKTAKINLLVPMHHDLYGVNGVSPSVFVSAIEKINPYQCYKIFSPGEKAVFSK